MAWGVIMPSEFGRFFPHGDYVGYQERLAKYYDEEMSTESKALFVKPASYAYHVSEKFIQKESSKVASLSLGPILEHEWPAEFATIKTYTALGSLIKLNSRKLAIDQSLKTIIERLEPHLHQFRRINITMPKGVTYPMQYYTMVVGNFFDSFSPEVSAKESWEATVYTDVPRYQRYRLNFRRKEQMNGIALSKKVFGGAHVWRELCLRDAVIVISDELQSEITKAGLRLPKHYKMLEV